MGNPYIGEIRMFGGNYAPANWALCDGRLLSIAENEALFNLIGTTYGGDGTSTFALPDLRGRIPIHQGQGPGLSNHTLGEAGGVESVTLTAQQIPAHAHAAACNSGTGSQQDPSNGVWAAAGAPIYGSGPADSPMNPSAILPAGGSQPHDNMAPFLALNFIISLQGVYPSPS